MVWFLCFFSDFFILTCDFWNFPERGEGVKEGGERVWGRTKEGGGEWRREGGDGDNSRKVEVGKGRRHEEGGKRGERKEQGGERKNEGKSEGG